MEFSPGQWWQKFLAVVFAGCAAGLYLVAGGGWLSTVFWVAVVLCLMMAIMSLPILYRKWMAFAERLSVWMVRILFTLVYIMVVPILAAVRAVGARRAAREQGRSSAWLKKDKTAETFEDLERMG